LHSFLREADGFILVYSVINRTTFNALEKYLTALDQVKEDDPYGDTLAICGNKMDLDKLRQVSLPPLSPLSLFSYFSVISSSSLSSNI
jgi:GTPase SAR1 family protein